MTYIIENVTLLAYTERSEREKLSDQSLCVVIFVFDKKISGSGESGRNGYSLSAVLSNIISKNNCAAL